MKDEDVKTIIGTGSKISIALLVCLLTPTLWILSILYEMKTDIAGLKNEVQYLRNNCWTINDMERYRFTSQINNASIGVKLPEVQDIVRQRNK